MVFHFKMTRREFLKDGCSLCLALSGGTFLLSALDSCTPIPIFRAQSENHRVKIPLQKFTDVGYLIVRPSDYSYDVAVLKTNDEYKAFIMKCTHADNPVKFDGIEFRCNLHGSVFDKTGKVEKGPAEKPLFILQTMKQDDYLIVSLI